MSCCKAVEESPSPTNRGKGDKHRLFTRLTAVQVDNSHANTDKSGLNIQAKQASMNSNKKASGHASREDPKVKTNKSSAKNREYALASVTR